MLKVIVLGCMLCVGTGATAYWVKSADNAAAHAAQSSVNPAGADSSMKSVLYDLHSRAHQNELPVQVFEDPL